MKTATLFLMTGILIFTMVGGAVAEDKPAAPAKPMIAKNVGDKVPEWTATTVDTKETIKSTSISGDYALIFVNSSCSACRKEMNSLSKMTFKGIDVYIAAADFSPEKAIKVYRDRMKATFPILDASDFKLLYMFDFGYTPATVIVKDGKVAYIKAGFRPQDEQDILKEFGKYAN